MKLRDYQERALVSVDAQTHHAVCLVSPTGSGKSVMGREWVRRRVERGQRGLMVAHRIELLRQFQGHLETCGVESSVIAPGYRNDPFAAVQCASLDTLVARADSRPKVDFVLWDEAHHAQAASWREMMAQSYLGVPLLGLTATPQRSDGKPLENFGAMVVAAQYSELLTAGHIVNVKIYRPEECIAPNLAHDPVKAWVKYAGHKSGFIFASGIEQSKTIVAGLVAEGIAAEHIDGEMGEDERRAILDRFRSGKTTALSNVFLLTEGIDVPNAEVCMLARGATHAGTYLQMVGRVLRPAPGKEFAILIDLPGVSHENAHDLPVADRIYSLEGRAIKTTEGGVRMCGACMCTMPAGLSECPECGQVAERKERVAPRMFNLELVEFFRSGADLARAPDDMKQREYMRLRATAKSRGFGLTWVVKEYRALFGSPPALVDVGPEEKQLELTKLQRFGAARGFKPGFAAVRFKELFGHWPQTRRAG